VTPERERFSVPHAARDPKILKDRNLENEDIFELIKNPPEIGAVRIFEQPALFTFPKDRGGLQVKMPRAIICSATWGHLTRCCQCDDGTRQLAEITNKDALEKHGCLDMEDLQFEAEFLTWDQASQNSFTFECYLTSTIGIRVHWDPFNPDWIASAANISLAEVLTNTQHPILIHLKNEQKWATVVETKEAGKLVKMRTENADTLKTQGQETKTGYPTLRDAIQRSSPT